MKEEQVTLIIDGKSHYFPVVVGTEGEKAIDISKLRTSTGYTTLDKGFDNTSSVISDITYLDGEKGILRHRGYRLEDLAENASFLETSYLLIYGQLPNQTDLDNFEQRIKRHTMLNEEFKHYYDVWPHTAHPMGLLAAAVGGLSAFYKDELDPLDETQVDSSIIKIIAKLPTIAAYIYKKKIGQPFMYPHDENTYTGNFLYMMYAVPTRPYFIDEKIDEIFNRLLVLHADHEQNCSTSTVRMIGSSRIHLFASISGGISALAGALHGGANQKVLEMLSQIHKDGGGIQKYINKAKDPNDPFKLMGFGHRVYKNYDPRALLIKESCDIVMEKLGKDDPLLDIASELEEKALKDAYFIERKLYPNVDFYSGIIYKAMKIPVEMFTVIFAMARLPGWIAQWKEMMQAPDNRIHRPRQIYTGSKTKKYIPIDQRK
jgi:citrate synthase